MNERFEVGKKLERLYGNAVRDRNFELAVSLYSRPELQAIWSMLALRNEGSVCGAFDYAEKTEIRETESKTFVFTCNETVSEK